MEGRGAAIVIGVVGALVLLAGLATDDEVWSALSLMVGVPMAAVGALTLGWSRLDQVVGRRDR